MVSAQVWYTMSAKCSGRTASSSSHSNLLTPCGRRLEAGVGSARHEQRDGDAVRPQLGVEALGEGVDAGLGGGVDRPPRPRAAVARAGDVDDLAVALLLELGREGPAAHDGAGEVQVDDAAVDLVVHLLDGRHLERAAGVVDEEIDLAEGRRALLRARARRSPAWSRRPRRRRPSSRQPRSTSAVALRAFSLRSIRTRPTWSALANSSAVALANPEPTPVITATFPFRDSAMNSTSFRFLPYCRLSAWDSTAIRRRRPCELSSPPPLASATAGPACSARRRRSDSCAPAPERPALRLPAGTGPSADTIVPARSAYTFRKRGDISLYSPSMSWVTSAWPSQSAPDPMPIVGMSRLWVMMRPSAIRQALEHDGEAAAAGHLHRSRRWSRPPTTASCAGSRMRPARTIFCLVTPTCPITGMPAPTIARTQCRLPGTSPRGARASAPPSFIRRVAFRTASSAVLYEPNGSVVTTRLANDAVAHRPACGRPSRPPSPRRLQARPLPTVPTASLTSTMSTPAWSMNEAIGAS